MSTRRTLSVSLSFCLIVQLLAASSPAADAPLHEGVEGQPLAANVERVVRTFELLGSPLNPELAAALADAARRRDAVSLQRQLDPQVLLTVSINPELRVKVARGPAIATLQQWGYRPVLIKVFNEAGVTRPLRISSPQAGPAYAGVAELSLQRQQQTQLGLNLNVEQRTDRFLDVQTFTQPPLTPELSGLEVEYAVAVLSASESGRREATIAFDIGQGTQDLGFRAETPILFDIRPAIPVRVRVRDQDGSPTTARFVFRDAAGHVYPPQAKRLAPDLFFQPQVYRRDGDIVLLPPGRVQMDVCRGPEYVVEQRAITVPETALPEPQLEVRLQRWVNPQAAGFYCGDHHIHGAGCAHYESPTQGVTPADMFRQVQGEGLHVGCVLTWGPCFEFQRNYFSPLADRVSEPFTLLKYDLEISGFGSAALGHVCLLNLRDQTYPGSDGSKTKGWPTWTVPVLRWCREQGGVTGFPHSALRVDPPAAMARLLSEYDSDGDRALTATETGRALLPERFSTIDLDRDGRLTLAELTSAAERAADRLPNVVLPEMDGGGAMEICVAVAEGVCDFISAMDTPRLDEWNLWYHLLNCGYPLKLSGETDFPCMSSLRVGQGRVYVQLGDVNAIDFGDWCRGLAAGRSYVSDGYAHALAFTVAGAVSGGDDVHLPSAGEVEIRARVAFAEETPIGVAYGTTPPPQGPRMVGDTRELHAERSEATQRGGMRKVEIVVNGGAVAFAEIPADAREHELSFRIPIEQSSWVALRQFPQLHTNPVNVLVAGRPVRASAASAHWCAECVRLLWERARKRIAPHEQAEAEAAYRRSIARFKQIAQEAEPTIASPAIPDSQPLKP